MVQEHHTQNNKTKISLDMRIIILILLAIIGGMLFAWTPWSSAGSKEARTISVSGEAKITQAPDEFVFNPTYQFKDEKKETALAVLTKKNEEIVGKLKNLGVQDSNIKTASDGYNYDPIAKNSTYSLQLTVKVGNKELAQKVQDYLVTTEPMGQVTPQANFSDEKRKELENKARDEATKDARAKADQSGRNLGFKVGKVKSVNDGAGFNGDLPYNRTMSNLTLAEDGAKQQSLPVQPGENDLNYSVTVVYYVK